MPKRVQLGSASKCEQKCSEDSDDLEFAEFFDNSPDVAKKRKGTPCGSLLKMELLRNNLAESRTTKEDLDRRAHEELEGARLGARLHESGSEDDEEISTIAEAHEDGREAVQNLAKAREVLKQDRERGRCGMQGEGSGENAHEPMAKLTIRLQRVTVSHLCRSPSPTALITDVAQLSRVEELDELRLAFLLARHQAMRSEILREIAGLKERRTTFSVVADILLFVCENREDSLLTIARNAGVDRLDSMFDIADLFPAPNLRHEERLRNCILNVEDFLTVLPVICDYASWRSADVTTLLTGLCRIYLDENAMTLWESISSAIAEIMESLPPSKVARVSVHFADQFHTISSHPSLALQLMSMLCFHRFFDRYRMRALLPIFRNYAPEFRGPLHSQISPKNNDLAAVVQIVPSLVKGLMQNDGYILYVLLQLLDLAVTARAIASERVEVLNVHADTLKKAEFHMRSNKADSACLMSVNRTYHRLTVTKNRGYTLAEWSSDSDDNDSMSE